MSDEPTTERAGMPQTSGAFRSQPNFAQVTREVRPAPPRYRNEIGKFKIHRSSLCVGCGRCIAHCPSGIDLVEMIERVVAEGDAS